MKIILVVFSLFLSQSGFGLEISPTAELRRASFLLRGELPSPEDYAKVLNAKNKRRAIEEIEQAYLKSPEYALRMRIRIQELFSTKQESTFHRKELPLAEFNQKVRDISKSRPTDFQINTNALDQLFFSIITKNLSWDNLLISKKYTFKVRNEFGSFLTDREFLNAVFADEFASIDEFSPSFFDVEAKSENQKAVLAGSITTSRFFTRFQTTKLNQNRRRAAAVFRIFLCDNLKPVILPSSSEDKELLNLSLNGNSQNTNSMGSISTDDRHAKDKQCQSCHYKLDPAAKTFRGSSLNLSSQPASGALVFRRRDGTMVNIPVSGIGQLAEAITQQPEYAQCQVKHFWNWFVGKDVFLEPKRQMELVEAFEKVGRKPNDFLKILLASKEFRNFPVENRINTFSHVEPIFKACNSCHVNEPKTPQMAKYPFAIDKNKNFDLLESFVKEIDLKRNGLSRKMPPPEAGWNLGEDEFSILKEWISQGARDEDGQVYLTQREIDELLPKEQQNVKLIYKTTFDDTYFRYLSGFDFNTTLASLLNSSTTSVYAQPREFGFKNPTTGAPYILTPNGATISAEVQIINNELNRLSSNFWEQNFGLSGNEFWTPWSNLEKNRQAEILNRMIDFAIGPKVLGPKSQAQLLASLQKGIDSYVAKNKDRIMQDILKRALLLIFSSERFQTI